MAVTNKIGNSIWSDQDSISITGPKILTGLVVYCTHSSNAALVELGDDVSGTSYPTLFKIEVPAANDYAFLDFSGCPIRFPNGIRIKDLDNANITLITIQGI